MAHPPTPAVPPAATPDAPEIQAVLAAIQSLSTTMAVARALVASGRAVELEGLENEAARLTAALACLEEGSAPLLRPALDDCLRELERLDLALRLP